MSERCSATVKVDPYHPPPVVLHHLGWISVKCRRVKPDASHYYMLTELREHLLLLSAPLHQGISDSSHSNTLPYRVKTAFHGKKMFPITHQLDETCSRSLTNQCILLLMHFLTFSPSALIIYAQNIPGPLQFVCSFSDTFALSGSDYYSHH